MEKDQDEWVGSLIVDSDGATLHEHQLRKPGKVTLSGYYRYRPTMVSSELAYPFLLPGASLWLDEVCAPEVRVNRRAINDGPERALELARNPQAVVIFVSRA